MVERHVANVNVDGSTPFTRFQKNPASQTPGFVVIYKRRPTRTVFAADTPHMANQISVIKPYRWEGLWVFDDERVGLIKEVFISGADTIIDLGVAQKGIQNADKGFLLLFSSDPFPGADMELNWLAEEFGGNVYKWNEQEGWLCPALLRYFDTAPKQIFIQMKELRS